MAEETIPEKGQFMIDDTGQTREQLLAEIEALRQRVSEFAGAAAEPSSEIDKSVAVGVLETAGNVTTRRLVDTGVQLTEDEAKFRRLSEKAVVGVYIIRDGKMAYVNPWMARTFGYSAEEMIGQLTPRDLIHPDDVDRVMKQYGERMAGAEAPQNSFYRAIRRDGSALDVEAYAQLIEYDGETEVMGTVIDITESRREAEKARTSEKALAREKALTDVALDSQQDTFFLFEPASGRALRWNRAFRDITGYTDEEIAGMVAPDSYYGPEDLQRASIFIEDVLKTGMGTIELELICKDGRKVPVEYRVSIVKDEAEEPQHIISIGRDITERKRAEEALRESEQRHRAMTANISDVIGIMRADGVIAFKSSNITKWFGWQPEDLVGTDGWLTVHPDDMERIQQEFGALLVAGPHATHTVEYRYRCKDGTYCWIDLTATNMLHDRAIGGVLLNYHDITESKSAEQTLHEIIGFNEAVLAAAPVGIATYRHDGPCVSANDAIPAMVGATKEQVLQQNFREIESWKAAGLFGDAEKALSEGVVGRREIHVRSTFGREAWLDCRVLRFQSEGQPHLLLVVDDISERKIAENELRRSEERFSKAFLSSPNLGAITALSDGRIVEVNDAFARASGYSHGELLGKSTVDLQLWSASDRAQMLEELRDKGAVKELAVELRNKSGEVRSVLLSADTIDLTGEQPCLISTAIDVTERKQLEEQLQQSQKMEAVGRLAGGVAHDFNNVLCAITGNATLALDDLSAGDPLRESMEEISKAAERAADLTRQLLAFSRKQIIDPKVIDLSQLIERLHTMLVRLIGEDIILRTFPQQRLGQVRVDPGQIEQIVLNLAINARDAMPDGGELLIDTADILLDDDYCEKHSTATPGAYVMLAVSDTGGGMSAEVREKIFEPFFTTKEMGQGTGLGLATVFGIVEQSGGRIEVYSELGEGSSFKVYFPRVADKAATITRSDLLKPAGGKETVLLVEDDDMVRSLTMRLLKRMGYKVLAAESPGDALVMAEQHKGAIDLLLTDVVMPLMNGHELAERLSELRPEVKVLYTSGHTQNVIAHHGVLNEGVQFIGKPYSLDTLATRVRKVLDQGGGE